MPACEIDPGGRSLRLGFCQKSFGQNSVCTMERLSLDTSATISEGDLRVYEENLIKKVKAEEYEEALKIANKKLATQSSQREKGTS
ncbi:hypothetical protein HKI87_06g42600 [Chloropicon roscoffensis]|uniref:Uncharacterized protein n=1 Tax=Chloropicon roscoffensis TaxID=1461544 RepID=A0AAX4P9E4_9CHLO